MKVLVVAVILTAPVRVGYLQLISDGGLSVGRRVDFSAKDFYDY